MNVIQQSGARVPLMDNFGNTWRCVANCMFRLYYLHGNNAFYAFNRKLGGTKTGLYPFRRDKSLPSAGNQ